MSPLGALLGWLLHAAVWWAILHYGTSVQDVVPAMGLAYISSTIFDRLYSINRNVQEMHKTLKSLFKWMEANR